MVTLGRHEAPYLLLMRLREVDADLLLPGLRASMGLVI
jgi:hypothetical protein